MILVGRVLGAAAVSAVLLGLTGHPAAAATKTAPAAASHSSGVPRVFQVTPPRVNLQTQPNIMLVGQNLTQTTQVLVGGRPATTVEATGSTLLAKLPEGLTGGSYSLQVVGNGASTTADDRLLVDDSLQGPSQMTMLTGGGLLALLLLVMRMGRNRTYSWSR
jgi:hypothetical protein